MRLAAAILLAAGVVAACGGSGASSAPPDAIKLMLVYSKSGAVAFPQVPDGARAAVKAINEAGGVRGRKLYLIVCDDGGTPTGAQACGQEALSQGVVALVGSVSTYGADFLPALAARRIPSIGPEPSSTADFISPANFPLGAGPPGVFAALPYFLARSGARRITLVAPDLAAAAGAQSIGNIGLLPFHIEIRSQVSVPTTAPDMAPYVAQATDGGTDGVVVILPGPQAINFIQGLRQTAPTVRVAALTTDPGALRTALGASIAGITTAVDELPPNAPSPAAEEYMREMRASGYSDLNGFQENAWLAVHVFAKLASQLPELTSPTLWNLLNHTRGLRTGLTPPVQWVNGGVATLPRIFSACEMDATYTSSGSLQETGGGFYDAFHTKACPAP